MPPPPDCSTALPKGPAFGAQLASVPGSPRLPSKGNDPRQWTLAAGLPSWPQQAWTDRLITFPTEPGSPDRRSRSQPDSTRGRSEA
jgi:hypothetical protein